MKENLFALIGDLEYVGIRPKVLLYIMNAILFFSSLHFYVNGNASFHLHTFVFELYAVL